MPYTLITVTHGGTVSHSRGYETLRMCQEARSIALYGMPIAELEAVEKREREFQAEMARLNEECFMTSWRAEYPPRWPTADERHDIRKLVLIWEHKDQQHKQYDRGPGQFVYAKLIRSTLGADGHIYDWPEQVGWGASGFGLSYVSEASPHPGDIKSAFCVVEVPDHPEQSVAA